MWVWPFALDKKVQKRGSNLFWFGQKRNFFGCEKKKRRNNLLCFGRIINYFFLFLIKEESRVCYAEYLRL